MRRLSIVAAALMLSLSIGLHTVVLQSLAWTTMLIERSQSESFANAVKTTFDGRHPCSLCKAIDQGRRADRSANRVSKVSGLDAPAASSLALVVWPPDAAPETAAVVTTVCRPPDAPPSPPPRLA